MYYLAFVCHRAKSWNVQVHLTVLFPHTTEYVQTRRRSLPDSRGAYSSSAEHRDTCHKGLTSRIENTRSQSQGWARFETWGNRIGWKIGSGEYHTVMKLLGLCKPIGGPHKLYWSNLLLEWVWNILKAWKDENLTFGRHGIYLTSRVIGLVTNPCQALIFSLS